MYVFGFWFEPSVEMVWIGSTRIIICVFIVFGDSEAFRPETKKANKHTLGHQTIQDTEFVALGTRTTHGKKASKVLVRCGSEACRVRAVRTKIHGG